MALSPRRAVLLRPAGLQRARINGDAFEMSFKLSHEFFYRQDKDGDTRLHAAITLGLVEASEWLIELAPHSCLLDIANDDLLTALHVAVLGREARVARRLVLAGANAQLRTSNGNTALHLACALGNLKCVRALTEPLTLDERAWLKSRAKPLPDLPCDMEARNYYGETSLHIAASRGHTGLVHHLLRRGADAEAREGLRGMTALQLALESGWTEIVRLLARECPRCLDSVTYAGRTAYDIAKRLDRELAEELARLGEPKRAEPLARARLCLAT